MHFLGQWHNFDSYPWSSIETFGTAYDYGKNNASVCPFHLFKFDIIVGFKTRFQLFFLRIGDALPCECICHRPYKTNHNRP